MTRDACLCGLGGKGRLAGQILGSVVSGLSRYRISVSPSGSGKRFEDSFFRVLAASRSFKSSLSVESCSKLLKASSALEASRTLDSSRLMVETLWGPTSALALEELSTVPQATQQLRTVAYISIRLGILRRAPMRPKVPYTHNPRHSPPLSSPPSFPPPPMGVGWGVGVGG